MFEQDVVNYRFLTTETNSKALYIFPYFNTTSSVKLFVVTVQIFVYKFLFTIVFFGKRKKPHETFHIFKMKTHFEKKNILKMKAHSKPHLENENMFLEK